MSFISYVADISGNPAKGYEAKFPDLPEIIARAVTFDDVRSEARRNLEEHLLSYAASELPPADYMAGQDIREGQVKFTLSALKFNKGNGGP
jgi:predicted RNase H-like HicB family nuclease